MQVPLLHPARHPRLWYVVAILAGLFVAMTLDRWGYSLGSDSKVRKDAYWMFRVCGSALPWLLIALVITLLPELGSQWRRRVEAAGLLLLSIGISAGIAALLKITVRRLRPSPDGFEPFAFRPLDVRTFDGGGLSFPSEHTAVAFAGAAILCRLYPRAWPVWITWAAGCGITRVMSRDHFLSDVYAGAMTGLLASAMVFAVASRMAKRRDARTQPVTPTLDPLAGSLAK